MKKILSIIILLVLQQFNATAQVFSQDFSTSEKLSDYIKSPAGNGDFDAAQALSPGSINVKAGKIILSKNGADGRPFIARTSPLALGSQLLSFSFKLDVKKAKGDAMALLDLGGGYTAVDQPDSVSKTFARLVFKLAPNGFTIRNPQQGEDGPNSYIGEQQITWIINRSGASHSYIAPDGSSQTVANNRWDLWMGNKQEFDERGYLNHKQVISNFKFIVMSSIGEVSLDDIVIKELSSKP